MNKKKIYFCNYKDIFEIPSQWYLDHFDCVFKSFPFLKHSVFQNLSILVIFLSVWIVLSWIVGQSTNREWLIFITVSIWIITLTISIFPNSYQRIPFCFLFLPPLSFTFHLYYFFKLFTIFTLIELLVYIFLAIIWLTRMDEELRSKKIDRTNIISSYFIIITTFFIIMLFFGGTILTRILFYIFSVFTLLLTFSMTLKSIMNDALFFDIHFNKFQRIPEYSIEGGAGELLNASIRFVNLLIPCIEWSCYVIKVSFNYTISTVLYFCIHLIEIFNNSLLILSRFIRFLLIPFSISFIMSIFCLLASRSLCMYIHYQEPKNLVFLAYIAVIFLLTPLCLSMFNRLLDIKKMITPFLNNLILPHIWLLLLLILVSLILVYVFKIQPYIFGILSFCSIISWLFAFSIICYRVTTSKK